MWKIFSLLLLIGTIYVLSAQNKDVQKQIDSLGQSAWHKNLPNLDSLDNPQYEKINAKAKKKIILPNVFEKPEPSQDLPITPFNLNNYPKTQHWFFFGQNQLTFNQSSFSNWNAGGNNSIGLIGKIKHNISFKKNKHYWENIFQLGYGFMASKGQSSRKTDDYINLASNYGYDLTKNFYLSMGFQFLSQFTPGYNYNATPNPRSEDRISNFMAPAYLNAGIGILYNPVENFQVVIRPVNSKITFVLDPNLQFAGRYGLERDGQKLLVEIGALVNMSYRFNIYKDINYTNQVMLFSNYGFHPERVDIQYNGVLNLKFNKYIFANVGIDVLYDHDQINKVQFKQILGLGFNYVFGGDQPSNEKKNTITPYIVR